MVGQPAGAPPVAGPLRNTGAVIPDRLYLLAPGLDRRATALLAAQAVLAAQRLSPKLSGRAAQGIKPYSGVGFFGFRWDRCLTGSMRVLRADWSWVRAEKLSEGDELIAFDEEVPAGTRGEMSRGRRYRTAVVEKTGREHMPCVKVTFDDGFVVTSTDNHPWLAMRPTQSAARRWINAGDLRPGDRLGVYLPVWEEDQTHDGGWMAGLLDGEGTLGYNTVARNRANSATLSFAQNDGPVLTKAIAWLSNNNYQFAVRNKAGTCRKVEILGGFADQVRLLGSLRPLRMIERIRHENRYMKAVKERVVVSVEPMGDQEVITMQTSTQTYVAEGMGSHNSYLWYQEAGINPFTMRRLAGKVIPMWIDDPLGIEHRKNPSARTRITTTGRRQVLIFRKAAPIGSRKRVAVRDGQGRLQRWRDVPRSYPGAPGRITHREWKAPSGTTGRIVHLAPRPHVGVRWRHPGLVPREFMQYALQEIGSMARLPDITVHATYRRR